LAQEGAGNDVSEKGYKKRVKEEQITLLFPGIVEPESTEHLLVNFCALMG
jgi:hypothetical protein